MMLKKTEWDEYDISGLYTDLELKYKAPESVIICRDTLECVYKKCATTKNIIGGESSETWTIQGLPFYLYGPKDRIDEVYEQFRRKLLGIIPCEGLTVDANSIVKMI